MKNRIVHCAVWECHSHKENGKWVFKNHAHKKPDPFKKAGTVAVYEVCPKHSSSDINTAGKGAL